MTINNNYRTLELAINKYRDAVQNICVQNDDTDAVYAEYVNQALGELDDDIKAEFNVEHESELHHDLNDMRDAFITEVLGN